METEKAPGAVTAVSASEEGTVTTTGSVAAVNVAVNDTATRRVLRTVLQVIASLILTGAFDVAVRHLTDESPRDIAPVVAGLWMLVVVAAQNWAENTGVISPILGTKPNVKQQTL